MCCQAGLANGDMNLIAACDTSGTLSPDCLPSPEIPPVTCEIDTASTQVLTL